MCSQAKAAKRKKSEEEEDTSQTESCGQGEKEDEGKDEEEIPQLVPMATPSKRPKLQVSTIVLALISFAVTFGRNHTVMRFKRCHALSFPCRIPRRRSCSCGKGGKLLEQDQENTPTQRDQGRQDRQTPKQREKHPKCNDCLRSSWTVHTDLPVQACSVSFIPIKVRYWCPR